MLSRSFYFAQKILAILLVYLMTMQCYGQNNAVQYLYVINSAKASFIQQDDKQFILRCQPSKQRITYFSDRPQRFVGQIAVKEFVQLWDKQGKNSFKNDHPNASLSAINEYPNNTEANTVLILSQPQYDEKTNTLTFTIKSLSGKLTAKTMEDMTLFIDNGSYDPNQAFSF